MSIKLDHKDLVIAVSGLKTGDNPQPGVPIIRSIRNAGFQGKIIGLVYDNLESGIYYPGLADEIYQMPFPSEGRDVILARIDYILAKTKIDILIPTLDSEIIGYIRLAKELEQRGIKTYLPNEEQLLLRDKSKLFKTFQAKGIAVPKTVFLTDATDAFNLESQVKFPLFIKGALYEAYRANTINEVIGYFNLIKSKWGLPVLAQEMVFGDEFNISLVGDGQGNILGMIPQRKLIITDKGKGFGGVVVNNKKLNEFTQNVVSTLNWRGPCEVELIKDNDDNFFLIEINPRFPAWIRLAEGAGQNLPAMVVKLALGEEVETLTKYKTGTMFIRHAEDIIADISEMGQLSATGELIRGEK
ncbi:MAG: ATP-grasp domain-containing protein [Candidatus Cloacimonadales bacterium]